ncbi:MULTISPECIES: copper homeostasis protein CutC [unclassified Actinomyces]|uniref:copper homeostasis protein CutC n=1 Tax=unclassified Actinomyces TaxID=2609248 RepID=UPI0020175E4C|nr:MULTISPECIES: copper homeostasis protein CutC [unclassified Actinomyces]MCL3777813.1 copper homeostasis protein CutC [Actinomyces sp. AC-20-1]MCL3790430.1 copper homeostasis protein CutC [Actinomyces sp. 187325]MCL3792707.1 copper homeostasis protein CutC [Actinomyces sp. 186855]MCL3795191.1 copper homeostasis protein CutC [Actinomyces sp. 217892]
MRLTGSAPSLRRHAVWTQDRSWGRPGHVAVEICTENAEGVRLSARAGADRAELCDNLAAGGTTPSIGSVEAAVLAAAEEIAQRRALAGRHWLTSPAAHPLGLRVMIRPRGGGFVFSSDEGRAMVADVRRIAALAREMSEYTRPQPAGSAGQPLPPAVELGFVVGVLTEEHTIDRGLLRLLVDTADGAPITFNKALDETRDLAEAYGDLGGLGVSAVLTSGGAPTALEGAEVLRGLVAAGGPTVIAAGTVRPENTAQVIEATGAREIHMRCSVRGLTPGEPQRTDESLVRLAVEAAHAIAV